MAVPHVAESRRAGDPRLTAIATNLNNPRKLFVGREGEIYVVEAGVGGNDKCLGTGARKTCVGLSGSITRIANGAQRRVGARPRSAAGPAPARGRGAGR